MIMKMSRRRFCQLTVASTLVASLPSLAGEQTPLKAIYSARMKAGQVEVGLVLRNLSAKPLEVLKQQGHRQGLLLSIWSEREKSWSDLEALDKEPVSEFDLMSRVGPRPRWSEIPPGQDQSFGSFRAPYDGGRVTELVLKLETREGWLELPAESVTIH